MEEYNNLFEKQNGKCAICNGESKDRGRALDVDHDHKTGKIRGLLCVSCNRGLGHFNDSRWALNKAIQYLYEAEQNE
jgi:hypothetical protein